MTKLDRSRPYGEHRGPTGIEGYQQDGREYRLDGSLIAAEPSKASAPKPAATAKGSSGKAATPPAAPATADTDARTDAELRTLVEIAGGKWTNRAAALAFLAEE